MTDYARMNRFGITPWERYRTAAAASITALLDREETERSRPLGRALDLGCGRGQYTPELARRGWEAVGIDNVPAAIEAAAAKSRGGAGLSYVVGDVTRLPSAGLGTFDFFLDIGCFQGLDAGQRLAEGEGASALANPGPRTRRNEQFIRSNIYARSGILTYAISTLPTIAVEHFLSFW
jgi:SAM-dependent methyltransferase